MGKFVTVINKIIKILFIILISSIVFSTTIIDKNIDNPFLNTVAHRNVLYYLIALFIGGGGIVLLIVIISIQSCCWMEEDSIH